jgi:hypothetical protein
MLPDPFDRPTRLVRRPESGLDGPLKQNRPTPQQAPTLSVVLPSPRLPRCPAESMRDLDSKCISETVPFDVTKPSGLLLLIVCPWSAVRLAATQALAMTGPVPRGEPVLVHRQDGPAAEYGHADLGAGLVPSLGGRGGGGSDATAKAACMPSCSARWLAWAVSVVPQTSCRPAMSGWTSWRVDRIPRPCSRHPSPKHHHRFHVIPAGGSGCRLLVAAHLLRRRELLSGRLPTAITVDGAEHRIGLTQLRMLAGRRCVGMAGVQLVDNAGKGSTIADAVMP